MIKSLSQVHNNYVTHKLLIHDSTYAVAIFNKNYPAVYFNTRIWVSYFGISHTGFQVAIYCAFWCYVDSVIPDPTTDCMNFLT